MAKVAQRSKEDIQRDSIVREGIMQDKVDFKAYQCPYCGGFGGIDVASITSVTIVTFVCGHELRGDLAELYLTKAFPARPSHTCPACGKAHEEL